MARTNWGGAKPVIMPTMWHWTSRWICPVTCLSLDIPVLKWWKPDVGCKTENQKLSSDLPIMFRHHLTSWSQNFLCTWCTISGVRKMLGHDRGKSWKKGSLMPFKQKCCASQKKAVRLAGLTLLFTILSCAIVIVPVHGSWQKLSPNCLNIAMVTGDVLPLTQDNMQASGISVIQLVRGVKQYHTWPLGSSSMMLCLAVSLTGWSTMSRHWWMSLSSKMPRMCLLQWMNFGTDNRAVSMNALDNNLGCLDILMLVILISSRCTKHGDVHFIGGEDNAKECCSLGKRGLCISH